MKILVIGKNGQLASSFKKADRLNILNFLGQNDFDSLKPGTLINLLNNINPNVIINCAAFTKVDLAEAEKEQCFNLNINLVQTILNWCEPRQCRLIHFSTDYVFDGNKLDSYLEDDTPNPLNNYGISKLQSEKLINLSSVDAIIFRISWVYSEFGQNFMKTMISLGRKNAELKIISDQVGCPCYAVNVAEVIYNWLIDKNCIFIKGIYHLVPQQKLSWYQFAVKIFEEYKLIHQNDLKVVLVEPILSHFYKTPARRPLNSVLNNDRVQKKLNIKLENFDISLKKAVRNYLIEESSQLKNGI